MPRIVARACACRYVKRHGPRQTATNATHGRRAAKGSRADRARLRGFEFTPPSAGEIARDLFEKIEKAIIQHCESFRKGDGHCDLCRFDQDWEVKISKDSGLTINQSKLINDENYIVVNSKATSVVRAIWVLWNAEDRFFSSRLNNPNARSLNRNAAAGNIELIFESKGQM